MYCSDNDESSNDFECGENTQLVADSHEVEQGDNPQVTCCKEGDGYISIILPVLAVCALAGAFAFVYLKSGRPGRRAVKKVGESEGGGEVTDSEKGRI